MAQVQFPSSPADGDLYTVNDVTYTWNNTAGLWEANNAIGGLKLNDGSSDTIQLNTDGSGQFTGEFRAGATGNDTMVVTSSGIIRGYRANASSKACFQTFVATAPTTPTGEWQSDGTLYIGGTVPSSANITLRANGTILTNRYMDLFGDDASINIRRDVATTADTFFSLNSTMSGGSTSVKTELLANGSATFLEGKCKLGTSGGNAPTG